jgi:hypothetical protein
MSRPTATPEYWIWPIYEGGLESVQDATNRTRGEAMARYCNESGESFIDVRAWKRHARALTRQEQWEQAPYRDDGAPREAPPDWLPDACDESLPVWEFCRPTDEGAVAIWVLAPKGLFGLSAPGK